MSKKNRALLSILAFVVSYAVIYGFCYSKGAVSDKHQIMITLASFCWGLVAFVGKEQDYFQKMLLPSVLTLISFEFIKYQAIWELCLGGILIAVIWFILSTPKDSTTEE